ncbi:hypothetical protein [Shinella sp. M31]|uniref:hypothetical protein n=1 Tax=Shinella sp. M31 TaxID=3368615 RepID=UPI003B9F257F
MRRIFYAALALTVGNSVVLAAQDSPKIEWELRHPFKLFGDFGEKDRYFQKSVDRRLWDYRRDLFVDLTCNEKPKLVSCSEMALGEERLRTMRDDLAAGGDGEDNSHLRDAWLATAIAWSNKTRTYDKSLLDSTERAGIKVRLSGPSVAALTCQWSADGATIPEWKVRCGEWLKNINIRRGTKSSVLAVTVLETGATFQLTGSDTLIRERLIVGLGDSFASGEGNPDIPVKLSKKMDTNKAFPMPRRGDGTVGRVAAQWLDRDCHRSLLGAQQRAAIHFSARRPREETIFLGFACSGAEILEGLIGPYAGTGDTSQFSRAGRLNGQRWIWDESQINQAIRALCREEASMTRGLKNAYDRRDWRNGNYTRHLNDQFKSKTLDQLVLRCPAGFKRPIDAVLLSIGGNDIGFSKIIASVLASPGLQTVAFRWADQSRPPAEAGQYIARELPGKYAELDKILENNLLITDSRRVIIAAYPNPTTDQNGKVCGSNKGGLTRGLEAFPSRGTANVSDLESRSIVEYVVDPLNTAVRKAPNRHGRRWTVAEGHLERIKGHGICAEGTLSKEDTLSTRKYMDGFDAYAPTTRWFRTINDSFMIQNQMQVESEKSTSLLAKLFDPVLSQYLKIYGAIHPNSMGAAVLADAYLDKLEDLIPQPR